MRATEAAGWIAVGCIVVAVAVAAVSLGALVHELGALIGGVL